MHDEVAPTVSVIVPIYNVESTLDQALSSIEAQTLRDIEIVCVNDGSTDRSPEIVKQHAKADPRVRLVNKPNGGYGSACNRGLDEARGKWIAILEPDDWIEPTMYEDMIAFVQEFNQPIDIVKTPYWRVIDPDTPREHLLNCSYKSRIKPKAQPFSLTDDGVEHLLIHHPSIWSALYRRTFLQESGIRFHEIPGAGWADNPFLVDTLCQARSIVYLDRAYYHYREETEGQTASFVEKNPMIPFERWHDMMDVLERLGIRDERVLLPLYRRAFTYLDYTIGANSNEKEIFDNVATDMFRRMDDPLVLSEPHIPPAWKARYRETKGLPARRDNPLPYAASLIGATFYSLGNIGVRESAKLVFAVADRDKKAGKLSGSAIPALDDSIEPTATLSIIVPVYNAEPYLGTCLESVDGQTYRSFELVCIDDGSTDASPSILSRFAAEHDYVKVITQKNSGPSVARNVGIRAARNDFVCFLDADDLLEPNACRRIAQALSSGAHDAVVYGWSCFPEEEANEWLLARTNVRDCVYDEFTPELLFGESTNPFLRLAVRREILTGKSLLFDEGLRVGEDATFLFSLLPQLSSTRLISDKLYRYRMPHAGSITSVSKDGDPEKCIDDLNMMISIFDSWSRDGLLERFAAPLVHWFISFLLYTILRQPRPVRDDLTLACRDLLLAHFHPEELRGIDLPKHDQVLIDVVLQARDGASGIDDRALSRAMLRWRIAEYGPADLVKTALDRIR